MKKIVLLFLAVFLVGKGAYAQTNPVEVKTRHITIGNGTPDTTYNISLTSNISTKSGIYIDNDAPLTGTSSLYSLYVRKKTGTGNNMALRAQATNTAYVNQGRSWGIWATAKGAARNFGVYTELTGVGPGAALYAYGASFVLEGYQPSFTERYAGYFYGNLHVDGSLSVDNSFSWYAHDIFVPGGWVECHNLNGMIVDNYYMSSSYGSGSASMAGAGVNSRAGSTSLVDRVKQLRTVEYTSAELMATQDRAAADTGNISKTGKAINPLLPAAEMNRKRVAFTTEEFAAAFPDLVREQDGKTTVNYTSLIPILVETIKELTQRIETLENGELRIEN